MHYCPIAQPWWWWWSHPAVCSCALLLHAQPSAQFSHPTASGASSTLKNLQPTYKTSLQLSSPQLNLILLNSSHISPAPSPGLTLPLLIFTKFRCCGHLQIVHGQSVILWSLLFHGWDILQRGADAFEMGSILCTSVSDIMCPRSCQGCLDGNSLTHWVTQPESITCKSTIVKY